MDNRVKIAMIQMDCKFGDIACNLSHAASLARKAASEDAKIICFPECFNVGYSVERVSQMAALAEPLNGKTIRCLSALARELEVYLIAPIILSTQVGIAQNAAVLIDDQGKVIGKYAKCHPIGGEKDFLKRGYDYPVFKTKYGNIGILICYDLSHPEAARILAERGAQLIFVPAAWRDKRYFMRGFNTNLVCRAIDNVLFMAGANRCGVIDGVSFGGDSQIVDPEGTILSKAGREEEIITAEINLERVWEERLTNSILIDSHPEDFAFLAEKIRV